MELITWVFHPNFNEEGKICCCVLGLRNEDSRAPYQTIIKILNINFEEIKKPLILIIVYLKILMIHKFIQIIKLNILKV